jgi:hypothetical protein
MIDHIGIPHDPHAFDADYRGRIKPHKGGSAPAPATTTTISKSEPPEYVKPYSVEMMNRAGALSKKPYQAYTGQRIAGLTPEHYAGLNQTTQRALSGNPAVNAAAQQASNTFNDKYLNQGLEIAGRTNAYAGDNPYLQSMIDSASADVTKNYNNVINPQLQSMERASGAFGNSGLQQVRADSQEALAKELGNVSSNLRYQNYNNSANLEQQRLNNQLLTYGNERQQQANAMEFAPALAEQDYIDAQNLLGVGDIYRQNTQQQLDFNYDQWQQAQNYPYQQLDLLANAVRTSMGGGGTNVTSSPNAYSPNSTASMIGTGLAGYGALQGILG